MSLLDIQKAFDSVDHQILCNKLSAMGVQSTAWFHSYLSDRKQFVNINGVGSDPLTNLCGVPQAALELRFKRGRQVLLGQVDTCLGFSMIGQTGRWSIHDMYHKCLFDVC
jgi:hypothetical protein